MLTPDFKGKRWCIQNVTDARPDIYNHNIETVSRLHTVVRPQAKYERTLGVLKTVKGRIPQSIPNLGMTCLRLEETREEVLKTLEDLREMG